MKISNINSKIHINRINKSFKSQKNYLNRPISESDLKKGFYLADKSANETKLKENISHLGQGVLLPDKNRNYCLYDEKRTNEILKEREKALPYLNAFLQTAKTEEQVLDALQILDKMLDLKVKGIDKMYPVISRFNDVTSPNVQVMLSGIYRKTLIPDAFGVLNKMLLRQTFMPNSPYFDATEEIGGAILEYLTK